MPPRKSSQIRDYFHYDVGVNRSVCQVKLKPTDSADEKVDLDEFGFEFCTGSKSKKSKTETNLSPTLCLKSLSGSKASNLQKHLQSQHPDEFNEYLRRCQLPPQADIPGAGLEAGQMSIKQCFMKKTVPVHLNSETIIDGTVKIICEGFKPFSFVEENGFLQVFEPIFAALNFRITRSNIIDFIHSRYENIRLKLTKLVDKKLVCVQVDSATRMDRSFLGISIQFIHEGKIVVFTLGAIELNAWHTGENLKKIILAELEKYNVSPLQIYTLTTGNASSVLNAFRLIDEEHQQISQEQSIWEDDDFENTEADYDLAVEMSDNIHNCSWKEHLIIVIHCAACTLQLSVEDTLKNRNTNPWITGYLICIEEARKVVTELCTQSMLILTKSRNMKKPILDNSTWWYSTYDMMKVLRDEFKDFCGEFEALNPKLKLSTETWSLLDEILMCLEPARVAMKKLQATDLTLTDIYRILNICHIETSKIGSPLALDLVDNFIKRRQIITDADPYYGCLVLDPRFSFELSEEEVDRGIKHLVWVHNKSLALRLENNDDGYADDDTSDRSSVCSSDVDLDDVAEKMYEKSLLEKRKAVKINALTSEETPDFENMCRTFFENTNIRLKSRDSILKFWVINRNKYPDLHQVAEIVFAVPATQVSIKRLFSQLKCIFSSSKYNLKAEVMNEMLVIKSNMSYLEKFGL